MELKPPFHISNLSLSLLWVQSNSLFHANSLNIWTTLPCHATLLLYFGWNIVIAFNSHLHDISNCCSFSVENKENTVTHFLSIPISLLCLTVHIILMIYQSHLNALVHLLLSLPVISTIVRFYSWANRPELETMILSTLPSSVFLHFFSITLYTMTLTSSLMSKLELGWLEKLLCLSEKLVSQNLSL